MLSNNFCKPAARRFAPLMMVLTAATLAAQMAPTLTVAPVPALRAAKGATAVVTLHATLPPGFHANSNTPTDEYLIPLTLKWTGGPLGTGRSRLSQRRRTRSIRFRISRFRS